MFIGIGVRLGFYAQVLSLHISRNLTFSDTSAANTTSIWFMLALLATLTFRIVGSEPGNSIHPVEYHLVSLQIGLLFPLRNFIPFIERTLNTDESEMFHFSELRHQQSRMTSAVEHGLSLWMACLNVWFWYKGFDILMENYYYPGLCDDQAGAVSKWAFFFVRTRIDKWYRTFHKAVATLILIYLTLPALLRLIYDGKYTSLLIQITSNKLCVCRCHRQVFTMGTRF